MENLLTYLIILSAVLSIYSNYKNQRLHYFSKPLATLLIIFLAISQINGVYDDYAILILAGLFLSLAGDIFLMLDENYFLYGLISFLLAHIFYIAAFSIDTIMSATPFIYLPIIAFAVISSRIVASKAGKMSLPVYIYIFVISFMLWRGWEMYHSFANEGALLAAIGATLFIISDFILGFDKFRQPLPYARLYILSTYYFAQYLIAFSI